MESQQNKFNFFTAQHPGPRIELERTTGQPQNQYRLLTHSLISPLLLWSTPCSAFFGGTRAILMPLPCTSWFCVPHPLRLHKFRKTSTGASLLWITGKSASISTVSGDELHTGECITTLHANRVPAAYANGYRVSKRGRECC